jgi:UDP-2-acetamido-3-amino-2,3-dideoxy-glucuronate N-acetyltransferase
MIIPYPHLCNIYSEDIGDSFIGPFVEIQKDVKIGNGCRIQSHTFICSGVTIEDNVFIGHGVMFVNDLYPPRGLKDWGKTLVKKGSSIGSNATILPCVIDGIIGAGSVVTKDVKGIVKGNPAC